MNEGLCVFIEQKLLLKIWGRETQHLHIQEGWRSLSQSVHDFGSDHDFTCLCPDLKGGVDPDDAFSSIPYYKGAAFFWYLQEEVLCNEQRMEYFIKAFAKKFEFKTVSSDEFRIFFQSMYHSESAQVNWIQWFREPGMPVFKPLTDVRFSEEIDATVELVLSAAEEKKGLDEVSNLAKWPSTKKVLLLQILKDRGLKNVAICHELLKQGDFLKTNCEVKTAYLLLALSAKDKEAIDPAKELLTIQGRMKYTRPVYKGLLETWGKSETMKFFKKNKKGYHPICAKMVEKDLS